MDLQGIVTVTGHSSPLTPQQWTALPDLLRGASLLRHGMCVGGDEAGHRIARRLGIPIVGHPGVDGDGRSPKRAKLSTSEFHSIRLELPYLERNDAMARECDRVVALVRSPKRYRAGEWSTVTRALRYGKPVLLLLPDGTVLQLDRSQGLRPMV